VICSDDTKLVNRSVPQMWPLMTLAGQHSDRRCRLAMMADDDASP